MSSMFSGLTAFSGDISAWDVSQVTSMDRMFFQSTSFNSDISAWDMTQVALIDSMFVGATSFQQDLCAWADTFNYANRHGDIFVGSGCKYLVDPYPDHRGPFCASTCQAAATVVWSTVSCPCSIGDFSILRVCCSLIYFYFPVTAIVG